MRKRSLVKLLLILVFVVVWTILLYFLEPQEMVGIIGLNNLYLVAFFVALFGGLATITFFTLYPGIVTFALAGLNPFILGIVGGIGLTLANLVYYYLGKHGRIVLHQGLTERQRRFLDWVQDKPFWMVEVVIFFYVGLTPLPNNLLTVAGGLTGLKLRRILIPLLLGNIFLMGLLSYLAVLGISLF